MKKNMKKLTSLLLALSMTAALAACGSGSTSTTPTPAGDANTDAPKTSGETLTLRMGNQQAADSVATRLDQEMCDRIAEATDGRITVQLYSDSALGDYLNQFDELMVGSLDIAHITASEAYDSRTSATMIPYLAFDYETLLSLYADGSFLREELDDALNSVGIHLGGVFCEGFNGIGVMQTLENANVPGAEKGCIIRSPMLDVYQLEMMDLGFRISSMPYSDTYSAMQTGVVAGLAGGTAQINYLSFRDIITDYYEYRYNQEATMILISQKTWDKISAEDQAIITEIIDDICVKAAEEAESACNDAMDKLAAGGINVHTFTDEELAAFAESCRANVWPELGKNYPDGWIDHLLEAVS